MESVSGGATVLTTTAPERAGFSIFSPITLDRSSGYQVTFDLQLAAESHSSNDRAGLSVIVLGSDHMGIELGFWTPLGSPVNEVWAQNAGFTHGEGAVFDTTQRTLYTLTVSGNSYDLTAGGTQLITGALRDYSGFGLPYTLPDFIFVGDDTFSADASTRFFAATVDTPEPASFVLGGLLVAGMVLRRSYRAISAAR